MNDQVYDRFSSMNVETTEKKKKNRTIYPKLVNIEAYNKVSCTYHGELRFGK